MNKELQNLIINGQTYEISDKQAREDISTIQNKTVVTNVQLNSNYEDDTKTLTLSINATSGTIGG